MLFSHRKGLKNYLVDIQTEEISLALRNGLWNAFTVAFIQPLEIKSFHQYEQDGGIRFLIQYLWRDYFKEPLDTIPRNWGDLYTALRTYFFKADWNEVYDFIEFVSKNYIIDRSNHQKMYEAHRIELFVSTCNSVLERENSAYRFVNREIVQITSEEEIKTIEEATNSKFKSTNTHIQTALQLMSDKKNPDFRNSIKESISAVEATCNSLLKDSSKTLGQALNELEKRDIVKFHKAEKAAFASLYGYTSESEGIRHALLEENNLDFEDAKFMLVACSAFCNYLIAKTKD